MNEKEREIRQRMAKITEEINGMRGENGEIEEKSLDSAESKTAELKSLKRQLDIEMTVDAVPEVVPAAARGAQVPAEEEPELVKRAFAMQLRNKTASEDAMEAYKRATTPMSEGIEADGGLIVPQDIQTKINDLKRQLNPLDALVNVIPVQRLTGSRVLEKLASMTPFSEVDELGTIGETDHPQFSKIVYTVKKYAGILPISKELLADTDQNLLAYVEDWLAKKDVVTRNSLIIPILKTLAQKPVANLDGIKDILNTALDPAISMLATVVTNQDGFGVLDKMKDTEGRYLLQQNPLNATQKMLFSHPVTVVSNTYLPSDTTSGTKAPLIIGSLKDAVTLFDRQVMTMEGTTVGGDAWKRDSYDIKCISRLDVKAWDSDAAVYGLLTVASA
jgi:HK97 family phage major capsid protein